MLKEKPEDFCVKEVIDLKLGKGNYTYFILKKTNWNTMDAINKIAYRLHIKTKRFGFAGFKDKRAITEQYVSVKNIDAKRLEGLKIKDIEIEVVGKGKEKIRLGDLKGNEFKIRVKGKKIKKKLNWIVNYYGEQRFGSETYNFGREVLKGKVFKKERRLLLLYVNSVQSFIWNKAVEKYIGSKFPKKEPKNIKIPLVGYETKIEDETLKKIIYKIMEKEKLNFSDFRIIGCPELSLKGNERDMIVKVKRFRAKIDDEDTILSFELPKGSYATMVVEQLIS